MLLRPKTLKRTCLPQSWLPSLPLSFHKPISRRFAWSSSWINSWRFEKGKRRLSVSVALADQPGVEVVSVQVDVAQQSAVAVHGIPGAVLFKQHRLSNLSSALALKVATDKFTERPLPGVQARIEIIS